MVVHAGCRQQMQPLSCEGCVAFLIAGVKETPLDWDKEMQRPWIWVDGDEEGEGQKGWLWRPYFVVVIYAALFVVLYVSYIICLKYKETFSIFLVPVVYFLIVFSAMIILIVLLINGITV